MKCPKCSSEVIDYNPNICGVHYDLILTNEQKLRIEGNCLCNDCLEEN